MWKEGDTVILRVDFEKGIVSWTVNGTTLKSVNNKHILDKTIKWCHFCIYKANQCWLLWADG